MDFNSITRTKQHARQALLVQYFLSGFIFASLLARYPALQEHYGMNLSQLSGIPLSMSIGSLCSMPLCVHLMGRYGSKKMTAAGFVYMALLPFLTIMPNIYVLYLVGALYGVSVSMLDVAMNGNSIIVENAYKRPIISMFHAVFYVGVWAGALSSILFITNNLSVQLHFVVVSVFSLSVFVFIRRFYLKETITRSVVPSESKKKIMVPKGLLLFLAFVALCGRVVEGSMSTWSTPYMSTVINFPDNLAPLGLVIYSAFMSIGRFFCDRVRARFRESEILLCCCIFASIGILFIVSGDILLLTFFGFLVAGLGISCLVPIIYSLAGRQKDVTPAMGIAMVNTISGTGFLFGPFVIGQIADNFGMRASFFYIWSLTLIMVTLTWLYMGKEKGIDG